MLYVNMRLKKPEIKSWDCFEHDPIDEWQPDDPSMVEYWCNIEIGIEGEEGADNFHVHVVTERMLSQIDDKYCLLVFPYYEGWIQVLDTLNLKLSSISELNWSGMSEESSKMFHWEYEGHH